MPGKMSTWSYKSQCFQKSLVFDIKSMSLLAYKKTAYKILPIVIPLSLISSPSPSRPILNLSECPRPPWQAPRPATHDTQPPYTYPQSAPRRRHAAPTHPSWASIDSASPGEAPSACAAETHTSPWKPYPARRPHHREPDTRPGAHTTHRARRRRGPR